MVAGKSTSPVIIRIIFLRSFFVRKDSALVVTGGFRGRKTPVCYFIEHPKKWRIFLAIENCLAGTTVGYNLLFILL